jgi:hypothetical protein
VTNVINLFEDGAAFLLRAPEVTLAVYYKGSWGLVQADVERGTSRTSAQAWLSLAEAARAARAARGGAVRWRET